MTEEQKALKKIKDKEYRGKNKDKAKAWREANKEYIKEYRKKYYEENKDELLEYYKKQREENPGENTERCKEYRKNNLEKLRGYDRQRRKEGKKKESDKKYRDKNKDKAKAYKKEYSKKNKDKLNEYKKEYLKDNPMYRTHNQFSNAIRDHLKKLSINKTRNWEELVGYTLEDLMKHLESLFKEGMTWDNYGSYWHIDHVRPKSWFIFESVEDQAFKDCWALSNLQPLEASLNCSKGNRYEG